MIYLYKFQSNREKFRVMGNAREERNAMRNKVKTEFSTELAFCSSTNRPTKKRYLSKYELHLRLHN